MVSSTVSKEIQHLETETERESREPWLKYRYITAFVGFIIYVYLNASRMNMNIAIVAMVNNSATSDDSGPKSDSCPELLLNKTNDKYSSGKEFYPEEGEFNWSPAIQGHILGSYYFSFVILQVPFGKQVERYGCKWFFFWGTVMAAVGTLGIPLASNLHAYAVIALQLLRGVGQTGAAIYWPERERKVKCIAGLILSAVIAYFMHESPSVHPKISKAELKYILSNQENALTRRRPKPPWSKIYRSVPVYALAIGGFGQFWGLSQFMIVYSIFLDTILHYPIEQNGYFSAVPFLLMFLFTQISSWLSTFLTIRKYASVDQVRKFWSLMGCLGVTACLLGTYFAECSRFWNIIFSSLAIGFTGFGQSGVWIVAADISPTFAASIQAICCTFGLLPSFILPLVVGYLTNEMQTIEQWNKIFFISIGIVMASGVIFFIFGSAEIQPWNYVENAPKQDKDKDTPF